MYTCVQLLKTISYNIESKRKPFQRAFKAGKYVYRGQKHRKN